NDSILIDDQENFKNKVQNDLDFSNIHPKAYIYDFPSQLNKVIGVASANYFNKLANYSNQSDFYIDILSFAGDSTLLDKYGEDKWINKKMIVKDWILSTSSELVYTYT
ncbi:hypothetical protein, partial [Vibrio cholerae]